MTDELKYLWQELGWRKEARGQGAYLYSGQYSVSRDEQLHSFQGYIIEREQAAVPVIEGISLPARTALERVMIVDPPLEIKNHPSGPCFQLLVPEKGIFALHYTNPPQTVDAAIMHMRAILAEALFPKEKST